jgi:hypothetical protein
MVPYSQDNPPRLPTKDKIKTPSRCQRFLIRIITFGRPGDQATEPQASPNCFSLDSVLRKENFFKIMIKHHLSFTAAVS